MSEKMFLEGMGFEEAINRLSSVNPASLPEPPNQARKVKNAGVNLILYHPQKS